MKQTEKKITGKQRRDATNNILKSTLRVLVLLRETLAVQGVPAEHPMHKAVFMHANLIGSLLPNDDLVSPAELSSIRAKLLAAATETERPGLAARIRAAIGNGSQPLVVNSEGVPRE